MTRTEPEGARMLVWDLPARVCHWGLAVSLGVTLYLAYGFDPESDPFKYHLPVGCLAGWFLAVRIALGWVGSAPLRWRTFFHSPRSTVRYFAEVLRWRSSPHSGNNPGTSWFAIALYLGVVGMLVTGFEADWAETWHGRLGWAALGLIGVHLLGLTLHALRSRALTPLEMIHGRRRGQADDGLRSSNWRGGLVLLALSAGLAWLVVGRFDPVLSELRVPLAGTVQFPVIQRG
jgi:cytochrome b